MINLVQYNNQNNVIPKPEPTQRGNSIAFKSDEKSSAKPKEHKKESLLYTYRGVIGFLAGGIAGEVLSQKLIINKLKNPTFMKETLIGLLIEIPLGFIGMKIAEELIKKDKN